MKSPQASKFRLQYFRPEAQSFSTYHRLVLGPPADEDHRDPKDNFNGALPAGFQKPSESQGTPPAAAATTCCLLRSCRAPAPYSHSVSCN